MQQIRLSEENKLLLLIGVMLSGGSLLEWQTDFQWYVDLANRFTRRMGSVSQYADPETTVDKFLAQAQDEDDRVSQLRETMQIVKR